MDAKLNSAVKKLGCTQIPGIEEVNLFKEDGNVIHFSSPKVQASIQANTFIISGNSAVKGIQELLPSIISQLGNENIEAMKAMMGANPAMGGAGAGAAAAEAESESDSDDDDIPDLVDNFEDESNKA